MPINIYNPFWKTLLKYLAVFALGCFVAFWFRGYSGGTPKPQIARVTVPEVKAKFEAKKPVHEVFEMAKKRPEKAIKNNSNKPSSIDIAYIEMAKENEKLKTDFAKETDSLKKVIAYNKAIQLNKFSSNFEDENIIINIEGIVQGEVKEITPSYTIKERKMEVPVKAKESVFRVLAGGAIGLNKEMNQAAYQLDLNFQNRKGNVISAEYLKIGGLEFGMVGYKQSIINIKR